MMKVVTPWEDLQHEQGKRDDHEDDEDSVETTERVGQIQWDARLANHRQADIKGAIVAL